MCYKYVWLTGAIFVFSFISVRTVNVQIGGVIDFGKKLSYQYEVVIPEQTDKATQISTLDSSVEEQELLPPSLQQQPQDQEKSKEHENTHKNYQSRIQERPETYDQVSERSRTSEIPHTYFNSVNKRLLNQQSQTQEQSVEYEQSQEDKHSQDNVPSYMQAQVQQNLRNQGIPNPYFISVNKRLIDEQSQIQKQTQIQEQPEMQEQIHIYEHVQTDETPNTYYNPVHKTSREQPQLQERLMGLEQLSEHQKSIMQEQARKNEQERMQKLLEEYERSQTQDSLRQYVQSQVQQQSRMREQLKAQQSSEIWNQQSGTHNAPNPFFTSINKRFEEKQLLSQHRLIGQSHIQESPQLSEQLQVQGVPREHGQSQTLRQELQDRLQVYERLTTQNPPNSYIDPVNKRLLDKQSQINQNSREHRQSQVEEQLRMQEILKKQQLSRAQNHTRMQELTELRHRSQIKDQLQTYEALSYPYFQSVNKRLTNENLEMKERFPISSATQESPYPNYRFAKIQSNYDKIQEISHKHRYLITQEPMNPQSNVAKLHSTDERLLKKDHLRTQETKNPYFYSVNKRFTDGQPDVQYDGQSDVQSQVQSHVQSNDQSPSHMQQTNRYISSVNKRFTVKQPLMPSHLQTQETRNPYIQSINKHLTNEQLMKEKYLQMQETTSQKFSFVQSESQKLPYATTNRYILSVNKRLTDGQSAQEHLLLHEHKHLETTNRFIYSENKRLTTSGDYNNDQRDGSDYDYYAKDWYETKRESTTKQNMYHHHHHHHQHHNIHMSSEYKEYEQLEAKNYEPNSTMFEDLTVRKRKRHKTTTITHNRHHHRDKIKSQEHKDTYSKKTHLNYGNPEPYSDKKIVISKFLREKKQPVSVFQQDITTKSNIKSVKESHKNKTYLDLFSFKDNNSKTVQIQGVKVLKEETNLTKQKPIQGKPVQQISNAHDIKTIIGKENLYSNINTQIMTNLSLDEIFTHPQKIKNDTQINTFTSHILQSGLQIFTVLRDRTTDYAMKDRIEALASKYELKYKEFLADTCRHEIKTKLGKQKVILNAIDASDRILKRLINYIVDDMDQKGNLRENIDIAINFQQEVNKERQLEFNHACKKFGICRSESGFPDFLVEFLTIMLMCDDNKFKLAIDSLTETTKNMDFSDTFQKRTCRLIKGTVERIELLELATIRSAVMILKNIIANKNRPLVVSRSESQSSKINSTLALLEIVNILEEKLPLVDANIIDWGDLRTSLNDWTKNKRADVTVIMDSFVKYIKSAMEAMPSQVQEHIADKFERVLNVY